MLLTNDLLDYHAKYNNDRTTMQRQKRQLLIGFRRKWSSNKPISYFFDSSISNYFLNTFLE